MDYIEINLTLHATNTTAALHAWDTLARVAAGLGLDGAHIELAFDRVTSSDHDDTCHLAHDTDTEDG